MMSLWIVIAAMLLLAVMIILWPLLVYKGVQNNALLMSQQQKNINIFQEHLLELENEQTQGYLDADAFQPLKTELKKTLLGDMQFAEQPINKTSNTVSMQNWLVMGFIASIFILSSLATYNSLGASGQYQQYLSLAPNNPVATDLSSALIALKAKLAENPEDIEQWFLLANTYAVMNHFQQAGDVYNRIADLLGEDSQRYAVAKAAYAQMMYQVAGERMIPLVQVAINAALSIDPQQPTALMLRGLGEYQQQAYTTAIASWEKAKVKAGKAQINNFIEPAITQARAMAQPKPAQKATSETANITINLTISPTLRSKVSGQDRVFVFAKAKRAMPLAAERLKVQDLPMTIVLDDSKAVMPTAKISTVEFVDITARVALSASPRATKGDLYTTVKQVAVHTGEELTLIIDSIVE